jgi:gamma-glutamyltranspeptidase/glutathione hydrolase
MKIKMLAARLIVLIYIICQFSLLLGQALIPKQGKKGMVVSTDPIASQVGLEILKKGGNAIDAAVAMAFAMAVTYPSCGNIAGGGFLAYYGIDGTITSFDFKEKAPLAAAQDMFLDENNEIKKMEDLDIFDSPLSIGVPGTVAGLALAHERLGSKPWAELITPAIKLAEEGFPINWRLHKEMKASKKYFMKYPSSVKVFLKNDSTLYEPGEIWKQPDLASTLKRIQKNGKDEFYKGKTAKLIVDCMKKHGGLITMEDLARYKAVERKPIHSTYRGYDIYAMGPPSSGGIAIAEMLNILEGFNLTEMGHNSALYMHVLTEAMRRAYKDRAQFLGDPDFNPNMPIERLISKSYADKLRKTIKMYRASISDPKDIIEFKEREETTHFSIVDAQGNAVSLTYSLNGDFGAYLVPEGSGFPLNNVMGDFNPIPGKTDENGWIGTKPNLIAPEKRMLSSMTPTFVSKDGKPILVIGSPGGGTIINTNLQIILNVIDFKMNIAEAVSSPRIHHGWLPDSTLIEERATTLDSQRLYEMMGHKAIIIPHQEWTIGTAMCICIDYDKGFYYGAADPRSSEGIAIGY